MEDPCDTRGRSQEHPDLPNLGRRRSLPHLNPESDFSHSQMEHKDRETNTHTNQEKKKKANPTPADPDEALKNWQHKVAPILDVSLFHRPILDSHIHMRFYI